MRGRGSGAALDRFRLAAAVLVIAVHTSPLASCWPAGDFWLTRVLGRVAVPFFLMVSGRLLARGDWRSTGRFLKKDAALYGAAIVIYLPLNGYAGQLSPDFLRRLVTDGTFYHLWYFPAVLLGVPIARRLHRLGQTRALLLAGALYLLGLGGDSYYGLASRLPGAAAFYGGVFRLFSYTRNGLFYVPLFLLLGAAELRLPRRRAAGGLACALAAMTAEGLWLRSLDAQRHDSMYLALPLAMVCLFSLLLEADRGEDRALRRLASLVYLVHPWCIVLVRGGAEALGLEGPLVRSSPGHFCAVAALSLAAAGVLSALRPLPLRPKARAWREVDPDALAHNAAALQGLLAPGQELMAVVKADAYGHGAVRTARCLRRAGVRAFAVACLAEGVALRRAGVRGVILILGYTAPEDAALLRRWHLTQTVADAAHGKALAAQGRRVHVHLALDTGMHRLGVPAEDRAALAALFGERNLIVDGVFSHLCVPDSPAEADRAYTRRQLEAFYAAVAWLRGAGYDPGAVHVQASYGLLNLPPQPCRYARAGIVLYGVPSDGAPTRCWPDLRPVLSLRARVASVRSLAAGEAAGYGLAFRAERETRLAVAAVGYGDGLPRDLPQRGGQALVHGRRVPMVGRMCMDQLFLDVTAVPETGPGDVVTLLGRDGDEAIPAEELAARCGTLTNELLAHLSPRLPLV